MNFAAKPLLPTATCTGTNERMETVTHMEMVETLLPVVLVVALVWMPMEEEAEDAWDVSENSLHLPQCKLHFRG